jgi:hypothetical protein
MVKISIIKNLENQEIIILLLKVSIKDKITIMKKRKKRKKKKFDQKIKESGKKKLQE